MRATTARPVEAEPGPAAPTYLGHSLGVSRARHSGPPDRPCRPSWPTGPTTSPRPHTALRLSRSPASCSSTSAFLNSPSASPPDAGEEPRLRLPQFALPVGPGLEAAEESLVRALAAL